MVVAVVEKPPSQRPVWKPWLCESCGKRIVDYDPAESTRVRVKCPHVDPSTRRPCGTVQIVRVKPS